MNRNVAMHMLASGLIARMSGDCSVEHPPPVAVRQPATRPTRGTGTATMGIWEPKKIARDSFATGDREGSLLYRIPIDLNDTLIGTRITLDGRLAIEAANNEQAP